jgi:hypothetical protein
MKTAVKRKILPLFWLAIVAVQLLFSGPITSTSNAGNLNNKGSTILPITAQPHQLTGAPVSEPQRERAPPREKIALGVLLAPESETVFQQLQDAANSAVANVGNGSGPVYGTTVHSAFQDEVDALGNLDLATEQSYLNGSLVPRGTPGSVRLDVVQGPLDNPTAVFDLKTGSATLTPARIQQIQSHLPDNSVPVFQIKPQ